MKAFIQDASMMQHDTVNRQVDFRSGPISIKPKLSAVNYEIIACGLIFSLNDSSNRKFEVSPIRHTSMLV
jgi:hypothetical protein